MKLMRFNESRFYLRRDPDMGWHMAFWRWRVAFQVVAPKTEPIASPSPTPKAE